MATITITDTGASITITAGAQMPRNILKTKITELTIIKTNIIKIDIGKGALENIFIAYPDVTLPATASPTELKNAINQMLSPAVSGGGAAAGGATEAKQDQQNTLLSQIFSLSDIIKSAVVSLDAKVFHQPSLVDDGGIGMIYKGYAVVGTTQDQSKWAIERIHRVGDVDIHRWADGSRELTKKWIDRETLNYI